jgi:hypothetical protein
MLLPASQPLFLEAIHEKTGVVLIFRTTPVFYYDVIFN